MAGTESTTPAISAPPSEDTGQILSASNEETPKPSGIRVENGGGEHAEKKPAKPVEETDVVPAPTEPVPTGIVHNLLSQAIVKKEVHGSRELLHLLRSGMRALPENHRLSQENKMFLVDYKRIRQEYASSGDPVRQLMVMDFDIALAQRRIASMSKRKEDASAVQAELTKLTSTREDFRKKHSSAQLPEANMFQVIGQAMLDTEDPSRLAELESNPLGVIGDEFTAILDAYDEPKNGRKVAQQRLQTIAQKLNTLGIGDAGKAVSDKDLLAAARISNGKLTKAEFMSSFAKLGGVFGVLFFVAIVKRAFKEQK